ncbi:hypothetical protein RRG08_009660 [Elysia crispata]|uniref:Uncharacterized protein n=1 Tax=Elysia crispata TaxID=231223 RepID=A0AAE0ZVQ9_9GAST|nr:hypothetical protein RRG08_009660 [Elysia crispata]
MPALSRSRFRSASRVCPTAGYSMIPETWLCQWIAPWLLTVSSLGAELPSCGTGGERVWASTIGRWPKAWVG